MSRIKRSPALDGESITAANLNARFQDYNQTTLNEFNARDAAIDLPQFDNTAFLVPFVQRDNIGKEDILHAAPVVVNGTDAASMPSAGHVIGDGANPTIASYGAGGLSLTASDVLRIYWHLNVQPVYTGTPWTTALALDHYDFDHAGGGTQLVASNATCWVFYLQWDITSNALANWSVVPLQSSFTTPVGGYTGSKLENCTATVVAPAWITFQSAANRELTGVGESARVVNWRGISGAYYHQPAGPTTVYGLRIILKGPMHPYSSGNVNYLVHTTTPVAVGGANIQLKYTSGRISTIKQRIK